MTREWRVFKSGRRAGCGHFVGGYASLEPGGLVVECPACPQDGRNLPENWRDADLDTSWLYREDVGHDANFRQQNKQASSKERDPSLMDGKAVFVEDDPFEAWILLQTDIEELSTCSGFASLLGALVKKVKGLRHTGVGASSCRHALFMALGMVNLQRGERCVSHFWCRVHVLIMILGSLTWTIRTRQRVRQTQDGARSSWCWTRTT